MAPGLLFVTMQPKDGLQLDEFNDWYNNEHGPTRLRLPFILNGYRYRATDLDGPGKGQPEWLATYDITDMDELTKETYTSLRLPENKSEREKDVMRRIDVGRKLYDFQDVQQAADYEEIDTIASIGKDNILFATTFTLSEEGTEEELRKWFLQEHVPLLSKIEGWRRSRWYKTSSIAEGERLEFLGVHEFKPENGLSPGRMKEVTGTEWTARIAEVCTKDKTRRQYSLYYTFAPAPRELDITTKFTSSSGKTRSLPASQSDGIPVLESYITTEDGAELQYRLEGSTDRDAPLIVLSNCILADWGIWDSFVKEFFANADHKKYRILRYLTRGRTSIAGSKAVTVDLLASDIITILNALRVSNAAAIIGDSLGGATVLNTALKYPDRINAFISCDTNAVTPAGNSKAWRERISIAEKESAKDSTTSETIVGNELAEITVRRWFYNENGSQESELARVKEMVRTNSLEGFKRVVEALFEYDLREEMKTAKVKGLFVVGAKDGVLPDTMKKMAAEYGPGGNQAECAVIEAAGHLPMVEKPKEFTNVVSKFLY